MSKPTKKELEFRNMFLKATRNRLTTAVDIIDSALAIIGDDFEDDFNNWTTVVVVSSSSSNNDNGDEQQEEEYTSSILQGNDDDDKEEEDEGKGNAKPARQ